MNAIQGHIVIPSHILKKIKMEGMVEEREERVGGTERNRKESKK